MNLVVCFEETLAILETCHSSVRTDSSRSLNRRMSVCFNSKFEGYGSCKIAKSQLTMVWQAIGDSALQCDTFCTDAYRGNSKSCSKRRFFKLISESARDSTLSVTARRLE
jgi:hypothetical protein